MTYFFQNFEDLRGCCFVKAGGGLLIEHRGSKIGHLYRLLGHGVGKDVSVAPYMIELTDKSETFPQFQHPGVEFIHMLEGEVVYQHGDQHYHLAPGDSLFFEASTVHGPSKLVTLPIRFLAIIVQPGAPAQTPA
jgi:mannose-6-phosphate isomerase-like protein (cupin superfamily)